MWYKHLVWNEFSVCLEEKIGWFSANRFKDFEMILLMKLSELNEFFLSYIGKEFREVREECEKSNILYELCGNSFFWKLFGFNWFDFVFIGCKFVIQIGR